MKVIKQLQKQILSLENHIEEESAEKQERLKAEAEYREAQQKWNDGMEERLNQKSLSLEELAHTVNEWKIQCTNQQERQTNDIFALQTEQANTSALLG